MITVIKELYVYGCAACGQRSHRHRAPHSYLELLSSLLLHLASPMIVLPKVNRLVVLRILNQTLPTWQL
jgi:hypothetical protein